MSPLQPIVLHGHPGPSPWKISILLEELNVPYTTKIYTTPELKQPAFLTLNRNGLAPVIEDPNTHLRLCEASTLLTCHLQAVANPSQSGAIMDYVLEQYDTEKRLSFTTMPEKYLMKQWLQFQTTTQGPLLQHIFRWTFTDPLPAARAGYVQNFRRALRVLDDELAEREWLVGDRCSAADLSHVPFHSRIEGIMGDDRPDMEAEFPHLDAWYKRMLERPTVQKVLADRDEALERLASLAGKK